MAFLKFNLEIQDVNQYYAYLPPFFLSGKVTLTDLNPPNGGRNPCKEAL